MKMHSTRKRWLKRRGPQIPRTPLNSPLHRFNLPIRKLQRNYLSRTVYNIHVTASFRNFELFCMDLWVCWYYPYIKSGDSVKLYTYYIMYKRYGVSMQELSHISVHIQVLHSPKSTELGHLYLSLSTSLQ